jgi:hypothetical protein
MAGDDFCFLFEKTAVGGGERFSARFSGAGARARGDL